MKVGFPRNYHESCETGLRDDINVGLVFQKNNCSPACHRNRTKSPIYQGYPRIFMSWMLQFMGLSQTWLNYLAIPAPLASWPTTWMRCPMSQKKAVAELCPDNFAFLKSAVSPVRSVSLLQPPYLTYLIWRLNKNVGIELHAQHRHTSPVMGSHLSGGLMTPRDKVTLPPLCSQTDA